MGTTAEAQPQVTVRPGADGIVVAVDGVLDLLSADAFHAQLAALLDHPGPPVCMDLSPCTFLDCFGVGLLVKAERHLAAVGRPLTITCRTGSVPHLLLDRVGDIGVRVTVVDAPTAG